MTASTPPQPARESPAPTSSSSDELSALGGPEWTAGFLEDLEKVRVLARSLIGDPSQADDLAQEAQMKALQHQPKRRLPWMKRVTRNAVVDLQRSPHSRQAALHAIDHPAADQPPCDLAAKKDAERYLVETLSELEPEDQLTLELTFYRDLDPDKLAAALGVSRSGARSRKQRALQRLRRRLRERLGVDDGDLAVALGLVGIPTPLLGGIGPGAVGSRPERSVSGQGSGALGSSKVLLLSAPLLGAVAILALLTDPTEAVEAHGAESAVPSALAPGLPERAAPGRRDGAIAEGAAVAPEAESPSAPTENFVPYFVNVEVLDASGAPIVTSDPAISRELHAIAGQAGLPLTLPPLVREGGGSYGVGRFFRRERADLPELQLGERDLGAVRVMAPSTDLAVYLGTRQLHVVPTPAAEARIRVRLPVGALENAVGGFRCRIGGAAAGAGLAMVRSGVVGRPVALRETGGLIEIDELPPGERMIEVRVAGFAAMSKLVTVPAGGQLDDGEWILEPGQELVVDLDDPRGLAAQGARLRAHLHDPRGQNISSAFADADARLEARLTGLAPGQYAVMVDDAERGLASLPVLAEVRSSGSAPVELLIEPAATLELDVRLDSFETRHVRIVSVSTGATARSFRICASWDTSCLLAPGDYEVVLSGGPAGRETRRVTVASGTNYLSISE